MMTLKLLSLMFLSFSTAPQVHGLVRPDSIQSHIERFNSNDDQALESHINNEACWAWIKANVPRFECPDKDIEEMYYFRWWVYRKHIKPTPGGYVITDFLPNVSHAGKFNTIPCAAGLHIDEGRWLRDRTYMNDYIRFWFSAEGSPRKYSSWFASSVYGYCTTIGDFALCEELLDTFVENFKAWEASNRHGSGLFWSHDDRDGGEYSISGSGLRPTLNSYMYADAISIARMARKFNRPHIAAEFQHKADDIKRLVQSTLWDSDYGFFVTIPARSTSDVLPDMSHRAIPEARRVRELYGYFPWKFSLPDHGFESAWGQALDEEGFAAPYGLTTAEQRHPRFMKNRYKRCQWDGSSWPFATSMALGGMISLLHNYQQEVIEKADFYALMKTYTYSQHRTLPYGEIIPWIGESLHPQSGIWLSRAIALDMSIPKIKSRPVVNDKNHAILRGKDYNHSSYCDLIISGLVGLKMHDDYAISVAPLIPEDTWGWFCLEEIHYQGKSLTVVYDKTGEKYNMTPGLSLLIDGVVAAHTNSTHGIPPIVIGAIE
jgi:hypothetical protein